MIQVKISAGPAKNSSAGQKMYTTKTYNLLIIELMRDYCMFSLGSYGSDLPIWYNTLDCIMR